MARPSQPRKFSFASCWGGDLSARARSLPAALKHISLNTVCQVQTSGAAKCIPRMEETQVTARQRSGRQDAQQTPPQHHRQMQVGGRMKTQVVPRALKVTSLFQDVSRSPALLTSSSVHWAKVPSTITSFPSPHLASSFKSDLHCAQPLFPDWNHQQILPILPSQCIHNFPPWSKPPSSLTWTIAVTSSLVFLLLPHSLSSTSSQRIYLNAG